jgi:hypothetical protein
MDGDDIRIVPAEDNTIYVPEYDPDVVYDVPEGDAGPYISFGVGYPVGDWLGYQLNWDTFGVWYGPWRPGWAYRHDWNGGRRWQPDPRRGHALVRNYYRPGGNLPAPRVIAGTRGPVLRQQGSTFRSSPAPAVQARQDFRGYGATGYGAAAPRPSSHAPSGALFGGYNRGTQARDFSTRGQTSRQAPVRGASPGRSAAPSRSAAPERSAAPSGNNRDHH